MVLPFVQRRIHVSSRYAVVLLLRWEQGNVGAPSDIARIVGNSDLSIVFRGETKLRNAGGR